MTPKTTLTKERKRLLTFLSEPGTSVRSNGLANRNQKLSGGEFDKRVFNWALKNKYVEPDQYHVGYTLTDAGRAAIGIAPTPEPTMARGVDSDVTAARALLASVAVPVRVPQFRPGDRVSCGRHLTGTIMRAWTSGDTDIFEGHWLVSFYEDDGGIWYASDEMKSALADDAPPQPAAPNGDAVAALPDQISVILQREEQAIIALIDNPMYPKEYIDGRYRTLMNIMGAVKALEAEAVRVANALSARTERDA